MLGKGESAQNVFRRLLYAACGCMWSETISIDLLHGACKYSSKAFCCDRAGGLEEKEI